MKGMAKTKIKTGHFMQDQINWAQKNNVVTKPHGVDLTFDLGWLNVNQREWWC